RITVDRDEVGALARLQRAGVVLDAAGLGAPPGAGQQRVVVRHAQPHERLQLERHGAVHGVGPAGEADAGGEVAREVLVHHPARPAHLVHDGWALAVAALDAAGMQEDGERGDEPGAALDHARDVLVVGQRGVLDRRHALLHGQPQPGSAVGVGGGVGAGAVGFFHGGANLLARVGAGGGHGAGRADAAGDEDLHVVGAAAEILARAAADLVHAVVAGQRPAVAVVGGQ